MIREQSITEIKRFMQTTEYISLPSLTKAAIVYTLSDTEKIHSYQLKRDKWIKNVNDMTPQDWKESMEASRESWKSEDY